MSIKSKMFLRSLISIIIVFLNVFPVFGVRIDTLKLLFLDNYEEGKHHINKVKKEIKEQEATLADNLSLFECFVTHVNEAFEGFSKGLKEGDHWKSRGLGNGVSHDIADEIGAILCLHKGKLRSKEGDALVTGKDPFSSLTIECNILFNIFRQNTFIQRIALNKMKEENLSSKDLAKIPSYEASPLYCRGYYFMSELNLTSTQDPARDLIKAVRLILQGYCNKEPQATRYVEEVDETTQRLNTEGGGHGVPDREKGVIRLLQSIKDQYKQAWVKDEKLPDPTLRKLDDITILVTISSFRHFRFDFKGISERIRAKIASVQQDMKPIVPARIVDLAEFKGIETEVFASTGEGGLDHKMMYALDMVSRSIVEKNASVVGAQVEIMVKGPVYNGLRNRGSYKKVPKLTSVQELFLFKPLDQWNVFFKDNPNDRALWVIEATHMDEPWRIVNAEIEESGGYPRDFDKGKKSKKNEELGKKRAKFNKRYGEEIDSFVSSGRVYDESILTRMQLLSVYSSLENFIVKPIEGRGKLKRKSFKKQSSEEGPVEEETAFSVSRSKRPRKVSESVAELHSKEEDDFGHTS